MAAEIEVLVVGGGPVGLSCGLQLARAGVRTLLVERRPTLSQHPKAVGIHARTMEVFRGWGVADAIRTAGVPAERALGFGWLTRMTGFELGAIMLADDVERLMEFAQQCPEAPCFSSQTAVEPILLDAAQAHPSFEARFAAEATAVEQDDDGVVVTVRGQPVRARYVIAAEGVRSRLRELCGITETAGAPYGASINVYFRAPEISRYTKGRPFLLWWIVNRDTQGAFWPTGPDDRWIYNFSAAPGKEYREELCADLVRKAVGADDLDVDILSVLRWEHEQAVADRWRAGRVFLAGDSAHRFPPHGGFGMNSGIQDSTNLAWKLVAVLRWGAADELLDTYEAERKPVAEFNAEQCELNTKKMAETGWLMPDPAELAAVEEPEGAALRQRIAEAVPKQREQFFSQGQQFGYLYESAAVVPDGRPPERSTVAEYRETAAPGARAPHLWLEEGERSTIDLLDGGFVLLAGRAGAEWLDGARDLSIELGVPITTQVVDTAGAERYGIEDDGAVLVRPDGHVGFRARSSADAPLDELGRALDRILGLGERVSA
jgi:2-polyprenyl-6-methoxyphenol hydroxylase-like FAD-dependent oxidoreductase